jgi:hypothetical protein
MDLARFKISRRQSRIRSSVANPAAACRSLRLM